MPFDTGLASVEAAVILDSGDFPAALDQALAMVDYPRSPRSRRPPGPRAALIGLGICVYHQTSGTGPFEGASVRVDPSGQVTVNAGSAPQGQGTGTMLAQIVADELQIDHETVKCVFGDTGRIAFGMGTFASRNAVMAGTSVQMASIKVRDKALQLAGHLLEVDTADLEFVDGVFQVKGSPHARRTLAGAGGGGRAGRRTDLRGMEPDLESVQYFENTAAPYSFGIHIAEVEVEPDTGQTTVTRYAVVNDAGVIVNPLPPRARSPVAWRKASAARSWRSWCTTPTASRGDDLPRLHRARQHGRAHAGDRH